MKKGTRVRWTLKDNTQGEGVVITDEVDSHVQVAIEKVTVLGVTKDVEPQNVIWCADTWLTVIPK